MVVSNVFYVHPYLGKISILTNIFQVGWNHQLDKRHHLGAYVWNIFQAPNQQTQALQIEQKNNTFE